MKTLQRFKLISYIDSKIITVFSVTDASVHDSKEFVGLIDENDMDGKADGGYIGENFRTPSILL